MVHTWAKDYMKYDGHNIEPIHIFLSGSLGTGALRNRLSKVKPLLIDELTRLIYG